MDQVADRLEALAGLPTYHHPVASPDGDQIALYYDETGRNELHVLDLETGEREQWSDGEVPRNARWPIVWGPDGERVYFHLDEDGDEQNDVYAIDGDGAVEAVVELDGQTTLHEVAEDGTCYVGSTRDGQMNLYRVPPEGDAEKLTDYDRAVWDCHLSPEEDRIAYGTNETDDVENADAYVANADGSEPRNLDIGDTGAEAGVADWHPDGTRLLVTDNTGDIDRIGVHDLDDGTTTWLSDGEHVESGVEFLDEDSVLAYRHRKAAVVPVVYDLNTGDGRELDLPAGVVEQPAGSTALDGDRVLLSHTTTDRRPDLLAYDRDTNETETLLAAEYGPFDPEEFVEAEYFQFPSDGTTDTPTEAVDLSPATELDIGALLYDSGTRPSPLIVNPHGGPRASDQRSFDVRTQLLCSLGFSVLKVNYRGSTGRGRAFVRELYDDWGGAEQGDVAAAVEHVIDTRDWIDEDQIVVFGGSYGGYSAYWQAVQYPELYDAAIAWIGLTDLKEMYETTMPHFRTELLEKNIGSPEENPALYRDRSPIRYAENLDATLLMLHGVNDRRVPVSQARLFRDRLTELGYEADEEFEYVELGAEGHASTDAAQKQRLFELLADFLDRRLGIEPTAPAAQ